MLYDTFRQSSDTVTANLYALLCLHCAWVLFCTSQQNDDGRLQQRPLHKTPRQHCVLQGRQSIPLPQQTSSSDGFHSLQLSTKAVKEARSSCRDEWRLFSQEAALTLRAVVKATTLSCSSATRAKESSSSADSQLASRPRHRPKAVPKATMSDAGPSSLQASSL